MHVILTEDIPPSMILSGLAKYTYSNIHVAGGLLFGRGAMYTDFMPVLLSSTTSPEKKISIGQVTECSK